VAAHRALPIIGLSALCAGCGGEDDPPTEDTGFFVAAVVPLDGDQVVVESANPELRVSANADPESCTADTIRLVAVGEGNAVVREPAYTVSFPDNGRKIRIEPEETMARGYWYMIAVRSGDWGCTDTDGRMIAPFTSSFFVP
jgi:hypothetical protein